jgi:hypothetical protein
MLCIETSKPESMSFRAVSSGPANRRAKIIQSYANLTDPSHCCTTTSADSTIDHQFSTFIKHEHDDEPANLVSESLNLVSYSADTPTGVSKRKGTDEGSYSGGEAKKARKGLYFEFAKKKWENEDSFKLPDGTFWRVAHTGFLDVSHTSSGNCTVLT